MLRTMHKWQIERGSRGDFAGPKDGPNPKDEYDGDELEDQGLSMNLEELKQNHDPNDASHQGKIGICFYCLMIEGAEKHD